MGGDEMDGQKLEQLLGKMVGDIGAAASAVTVALGDRLGWYKDLAKNGPANAGELAKRTGSAERYCREWLNAQAASGYLTYDAESGRYTLPPEQAAVFADESSPVFMAGAFQIMRAMWVALDRMSENYKSGGGLSWGDQHPCLFEGTERFFKPAYLGNLISAWLPALEGVVPKLERGAKVADVGCGAGASTILMAKAFPKSQFIGFDSHPGSIETARQRAREAGVGDNVRFEVGDSTSFPGSGYDLVAVFDCLHDMQDPVGAARHARRALAHDGTFMIIEPFANDRPEANHNPVGRVYYSASSMICVAHSLAHGGPALGAQAGEARLRDVIVNGGGFSKLRRATETPFNIILEARP
jgi:SAM-dependent methyltransferase